ncbi:MAG: hypothetical protein FIA96_10580 [Betaproteobacteria bacterium]|nr:hypothetical protein [Betaproteobacteria bacterium]
MNTLLRTATLLCALLLLSGLYGCAQMKASSKPYWVDPQAPHPSSDAVSLLHYAAYARKMGGKQLAEETERLRLAYTVEKTDFRSLQYAIALSVPGASVADHRRALQLLEPLAQHGDNRDSELRALASLMLVYLTEQRRLEDGNASYAQKLREEQQKAREDQRRAEELEKKLEALKDIEKSLLRPGKETGRPK